MFKKFRMSLAVVILGALMLAPLSGAVQASPGAGLTTQITNAPATLLGQAGTFTGTLNVTSFQAGANNTVNGVGTLVGAFTNTVTGVVTQIPLSSVLVPIIGGTATSNCRILTLDLGPLHLDVLGLVVDLNAIHLTITAQPGPGNLLGNLLCSVANLLNNGGPAPMIAQLLNNILSILGL